jgi:AraC-like DNA-binding protein
MAFWTAELPDRSSMPPGQEPIVRLADHSHAQRVSRAVALIRENFVKPLGVEQLAAAGMSVSSFHEHFRAVTSLTPLQFQKQLRLIEARRMMLADGELISNAAYAVGNESVTQFTREYGRMFGLPPARDMKTAKARMQPRPQLAASAVN